jgi:hypothetical protein
MASLDLNWSLEEKSKMAADDREQKMSALRALLTEEGDHKNIIIPMADTSFPIPYAEELGPMQFGIESVIGANECETIDTMTGGCVKSIDDALSEMHAAQGQNLHQYVEKYENIRTHAYTDTRGRQFNVYDDGSAAPTVIVCFNVGNTKYISINDIVIQEKSLTQIEKMNPVAPTLRTCVNQYRMEPPNVSPAVELTLSNKETLVIPNTTVPILLLALTGAT